MKMETFEEWLERLELISATCHWHERAKLVNIATRLRGPALRIYRTCSPQQRASYALLTSALKQRFTPIRIQAVQSSRFHERKQGPKESVDSYAQDLRRLFNRAYSSVSASGDGDQMRQSVLAYQFVAGLRSELKAKLVGREGTFEQLLEVARFEEARFRDVVQQERATRRNSTPSSGPPPTGGTPRQDTLTSTSSRLTARTCYHCGATGHIARDCPQRGRGAPKESQSQTQGRMQSKTQGQNTDNSKKQKVGVGLLQPGSGGTLSPPASDVLGQALAQAMTTLFGVSPAAKDRDSTMGPTLTSLAYLDRTPTAALVDTGSPVSIVSSDFFLKAAAAKKEPSQTPSAWREAVKRRVQPTTMSLRSYGGDIIGQALCCISVGKHQVEAVLQVQPNAPMELLLGTDILHKLGFALTQTGSGDLLKEKTTGEETAPTAESKEEGGTNTNTPSLPQSEKASVRLIQAARLPAGHSKLVRVGFEGPVVEVGTYLFEPAVKELGCKGVSMADAVVGIGDSGAVTLAVFNYSTETVLLEEGEVLGELQEAAVVENRDLLHLSDPPVAAVDAMAGEECCQEREEKVLEALMISPDSADLKPEEAKKLQELVVEFASLFALSNLELGRTSVATHHIDNGDSVPVRQPPRRVPFSLCPKVEKLVEEMLEQGVITPSSSPWASPIDLVAKKDGTTRFCVDYRRLNAVTKLDVHPLPRIDDSLDLLTGAQYFSSLDLAAGYWQVGMDRESQEKTAFTTHTGLYEFVVMPFGLCNAPATFQRLMDVVLRGLAREKCLVYLDDLLVIGRTFKEHIENLRQVFTRLMEAGLKLKPSKCKLARCEVEFLGYVVSKGGIATNPNKVTAVSGFPVPKDLKALRAFLGLLSYYRRFIPRFSATAQPLYGLTRKDTPFSWTTACDKAFNDLKSQLTKAPVLAYPQFGREFLLETDASGVGLGAVLSQTQEDQTIRPIAFASRTLQPHERNYGISELEALGVVWAVKYFRHYIYSHRCIVYTDHEALKALLNTPQPSGKLARWGMALQELDLQIEYRPGKTNARADALSRYPISLLQEECEESESPVVVAAVQTPDEPHESGEENDDCTLRQRQLQDNQLADIIHYLEDGQIPKEERRAREVLLTAPMFTVEDGVIYHVEQDKTLRIVPPTCDRFKLLLEAHQGPYSVHLREAKMHGQLGKQYWWP